jgi:small-conductance mechanosensitive channel
VEELLDLLPSAGTIVAVIVGLLLVRHLLERNKARIPGYRFRSQMIMIGLTAVGTLLVIMILPIGDAKRGQLLGLLGIVMSAAIALSSTTFLGNAMAGIMLRAVRNFRTGDFIRVGEHFGRVSERGLFHTEIQTEDRDLTTLPNLFLVTNPVITVRSSGTIISATVSLGYDVSRVEIEKCLLEAARGIGLEDPFVRVMDLGDFSVTYRVAGLLTDVKKLLSVRSRLRASILDTLHDAKIEIVSPLFMNQRPLKDDQVFIPESPTTIPEQAPSSEPEAVAFDKAEDAESLEALRASYADVGNQIEALEKRIGEEPTDAGELQRELERLERRRKRLEAAITAREQKANQDD